MASEHSPAAVAHLADLARLSVTSEEVGRYEREFTEILDFVARIERVSAASRPLLSTVSGVATVYREDVVVPSSLADALLAVAPERHGRFVRVPAIL